MSGISVIERTDTTVTISAEDWEEIQDLLENLKDHKTIERSEGNRARLGEDEARRLTYTAGETQRIVMNDVSPITIRRERACLSQRALAAAATVSPSYLAEIEAGKKPGSVAALASVATVLNVPMEHLVAPTPVQSSKFALTRPVRKSKVGTSL